MRRILGCALATFALVACVGTTGSALVTFHAAAAGPSDAAPGQPLAFDNGKGFHVTLTRARLHVGAVYLNRSVPTSGAQATACILPGIYVGEVLSPLDVDALSPVPQPFGATGDGTSDEARTAELWLTGGDVNADEDPTRILDVAGTATKGDTTIAFEGQVTIGSNWQQQAADPSLPGAHPVCKLRIVSPIAIDLAPRDGGTLLLRVDPRAWFANVDFAQLPISEGTARIADAPTDSASANLFAGLHASTGAYALSWEP